jgi:hypothetical protein
MPLCHHLCCGQEKPSRSEDTPTGRENDKTQSCCPSYSSCQTLNISSHVYCTTWPKNKLVCYICQSGQSVWICVEDVELWAIKSLVISCAIKGNYVEIAIITSQTITQLLNQVMSHTDVGLAGKCILRPGHALCIKFDIFAITTLFYDFLDCLFYYSLFLMQYNFNKKT